MCPAGHRILTGEFYYGGRFWEGLDLEESAEEWSLGFEAF
jgi:hypothetical protein